LNQENVTYDLAVNRRRELFEAINGFREGEIEPCASCANLEEKPYKDVDFSYLGGEPLPAGMGIQHFSSCNQRCTYCVFTTEDNFIKSQYDPIKYMELFHKAEKLRGNNWIDFSGGETTALKDFDRILNYFLDNKLGTAVVYSNATIFKQSLYDALKKNEVILTTSLDTGMASSYNKLHGSNSFHKVIRNLIRYRNSGTHNLWLKCVICESNRSDDDLWGFVLAMLALRPNKVMISPDFPYGATEVPDETLRFAAKLWYMMEELVGITPVDVTANFGDAVWVKYHQDLPAAIAQVRQEGYLGRAGDIQKLEAARIRDILKYRLTRILGTVWRSSLRQRLVPPGSERESKVLNLYRRTIGRFVGE
jgi:uncharacterized Fe-S cluster-containing radical SAM superfamily protein